MSNIRKATGVVVPLEKVLKSPEGAAYIRTTSGVDLQTQLDSLMQAVAIANLDGGSGSTLGGVNVKNWEVFADGEDSVLDHGIQIRLNKDTNELWIRIRSFNSDGGNFLPKFYLEAVNVNVTDVTPGPYSPAYQYRNEFKFEEAFLNTWGDSGIYIDQIASPGNYREWKLSLSRLDEASVFRLFIDTMGTGSEVKFISMGDTVVSVNPETPATLLFTPTDNSNLDVKWGNITGEGKPEDFATNGAIWGVNVFGDNLPASGATVNHTFVQADIPTLDVTDGDIWINTAQGNKLYIYELGAGWVARQDDAVATALVLANESKAAADGKINTYYQDEPPTEDIGEGDLWFDTNDANHIYVYTSGVWVTARDQGLAVAIDDSATAIAIADGKISTYFTEYDPYLAFNLAEGDLWYDEANKYLKRWNDTITQWDIISNLATLTSDLEDDARLGKTAEWTEIDGEGKPEDNATATHIFAQPDVPSGFSYALKEGDIWIDTDDENALHVWTGGVWVLRRDARNDDALTRLNIVEAGLDGKVTSFYQASEPTDGVSDGDLWFDTDDGNRIYIREAGVWVNRQDSAIADALNDAATAQSTADGKVTTYFTEIEPNSGLSLGDLWYQGSSKFLRRWNGTVWEVVSNSFDNTNELIDGAGLGQTADWDQVTGDDKPANNATVNHTVVGPTAPTLVSHPNLQEGDLWINTGDGNKVYSWEDPGAGYQWVARQDIDLVNTRTDVDILLTDSISSLLDNADTHSRVIAVEQTVIDIQEDSSLAASIATLQTEVDANTASISSHTLSLDGIRAEWGVNIDNNGNIAGVNLISDLVDDTGAVISDFSIVADKFRLVRPGVSPGAGQVPFEIDAATGDVAIKGNLIVQGSVDTVSIANDAITNALLAAGAVGTANIQNSAITNALLSNDAVNTANIVADAINATHIGSGVITSTEIAANTIATNNIALNAIDESLIADNAVTSAQIVADAVTQAKIASGAVGTTEIAADAVTANEILAGTITGAEIAANTITGTNIVANSITGGDISANTLTAANLVAGTITGTEIAANAIATNHIASDAITADKIAANAVTANEINVADLEAISATMGTVTGGRFQTATSGYRVIVSSDLADGADNLPIWMGDAAVPTKANATFYIDDLGNAYFGGDVTLNDGQVLGSHIANDTITSSNIVAGTIGTTELAADSVTATVINTNAINATHIQAGVINNTHIAIGAVGSDQIANDAVGSAEIAANAVTGTQIATDAVGGVHISTDAIDGGHIQAGVITGSLIAASTIVGSNIAAATIAAGNLAANSVTAGAIAANAITASHIAANTITAAEIAADAITASEIAADAIDASHISANSITAGEIAANAINTSELAANAVTATQIAANAVTASKINVADLSAVAATIQGSVTVGTNGRVELDGANTRIDITDGTRNRVRIGNIGGDYGLELWNSSGVKYLSASGTGLFATDTTIDQGDSITYRNIARGLETGTGRDGETITFGNAWSSIPTIRFAAVGLTYSPSLSGSQVQEIRAVNPSTTGFTISAKLKELAGSVVNQTDSGSSAGSGLIDRQIFKSITSDAFDDSYTYTFHVTVNNRYEGEDQLWYPGSGDIIFFTNSGSGWVQRASKRYTGGWNDQFFTEYNNQTQVIVVDGLNNPGGAEFGVSATGDASVTFSSVSYTTASSPQSVSATPTGAPDVQYFVLGGE